MIFTVFSCKNTVNCKNYHKICVINFTVSRQKKKKKNRHFFLECMVQTTQNLELFEGYQFKAYHLSVFQKLR